MKDFGIRSLVLCCLASILAAACSAELEDVGQAEVTITQVPTGTSCVRVTAAGGRKVVKNFEVSAGQSSTFSLNALPLGTVDFSGDAFATRCTDVTSGSVPTWLSDRIPVSVTDGAVAMVTLVMRRNGRVSVGVDFEDEPTCRTDGQACTVTSECCTGLSCVLDANGHRACGTGSTSSTSSSPYLYAVTTSSFDSFGFDPVTTQLQIVDLATRTSVRTVAIGTRAVTAIEVAPTGSAIYLSDSAGIARINPRTGAEEARLAVAGARDLVLSADGTTLYAGTGSSLLAIDAGSMFAIRATVPTGTDTPLGLALSGDGRTLAAVTTDGGSNPALLLLSTSPLALETRVAITGSVSGCGTSPNDVVLTNTSRALLWDSNCDAVYQVDMTSRTQLVAATIVTGRDSGSSMNYNSRITYSPRVQRAFTLKENNDVVSVDPMTASSTVLGAALGTPFAIAMSPEDEGQYITVIHRFSGGGADTLDHYDPISGILTRSVYTFTDATRSVRDMRIVRALAN